MESFKSVEVVLYYMSSVKNHENSNTTDGIPYRNIRDRPESSSKGPYRWTSSTNDKVNPWSK